MSMSALTRLSHTGKKFSEKNFYEGVQLYFEISLSSFNHEIFLTKFLSINRIYRQTKMRTKKRKVEKGGNCAKRRESRKRRLG